METTATLRTVYRKPQPAARCRRGKAQPPAQRTATVCKNDFLNHCFHPFWGITTGDWKRTERECLNSLSNLCNLYSWEQPDIANLPFPVNIQTALQEIQTKLEATDLDCIIAQDRTRKACLVTAKTFHIGMTLFYIPVRPLWYLIEKNSNELLAGLLTEIFCYLHKITGISFFNRNGYLCQTYDYIQNIIDDGEEEDVVYKEIQQEELSTIKDAAEIIHQRINKSFRFKVYSSLLEQYRAKENSDALMVQFCADFAEFAKDYPQRSIQNEISSTIHLDGNTEYIYYDQYLSFYWSGEDGFTDLLMDIVNADLQEIAYMEQPISLQWFDTAQPSEMHSLHFETRLFSLLERLIEILNDYDHEKYQ